MSTYGGQLMLGPIGAHVISVLRIMTPSEIDRYMDSGREKSRIEALAAGAENLTTNNNPPSHYDQQTGEKADDTDHEEVGPGSGEARVIPINGTIEEEKTQGLEELGILSVKQRKVLESKAKLEKLSKQDSSTVFLLSERKKLEVAKRKLVYGNALKSYNEALHVEIHPELDSDEPQEPQAERATGVKGILLNKKQY